MLRKLATALFFLSVLTPLTGCSDGKKDEETKSSKKDDDPAVKTGMTNLRQIGMRCYSIASGDNQHRFPKNVEELAAQYKEVEAWLVSPEGGRFEYYGNGRLITDYTDPRMEPLGSYPPGSDGNRNVLFADGSVRRIPNDEFKTLLTKDFKATKTERKSS